MPGQPLTYTCVIDSNQRNAGTPADFEAHGQSLQTLPIINYFSIGYDAKVAYEFNSLRDKHPRKLKSRHANMA